MKYVFDVVDNRSIDLPVGAHKVLNELSCTWTGTGTGTRTGIGTGTGPSIGKAIVQSDENQ